MNRQLKRHWKVTVWSLLLIMVLGIATSCSNAIEPQAPESPSPRQQALVEAICTVVSSSDQGAQYITGIAGESELFVLSEEQYTMAKFLSIALTAGSESGSESDLGIPDVDREAVSGPGWIYEGKVSTKLEATTLALKLALKIPSNASFEIRAVWVGPGSTREVYYRIINTPAPPPNPNQH